MKTLFGLLYTCFTFIYIFNLELKADDSIDVPASSWKPLNSGASLAMILVEKSEDHSKLNSLHVYIKNTSEGIKYLPSNANEAAIQIFYVNSDGSYVALRDYTPKIPAVIQGAPVPDSRPYKPGEVGMRIIRLTPLETSLVKKYPIICQFYISDTKIGGYQLLKSYPQQLTEMIIPASNK